MKGAAYLIGVRNQLIIGIVLVNLAVVALSGISAYQSRFQYEERAAITTQNLSQVLEEYIKGIIDKTDVSLLSVVDESEKQLKIGKINRQTINACIKRQLGRLPELEGLIMTDANGNTVYGTVELPGINVSDRDYFVYLRNSSNNELYITKPLFGRIAKKWVIDFIRRYNHPDGSFAGVVFCNLSLEKFAATFSRVNIGSHGAIIMFDSDLGTIVRCPDSPIGKKLTSTEIRELFARNQTSATYRTRSTIDEVERIHSYRKISGYPLYIMVGLAKEDYLTQWRKEIAKILVLVAILVVVTNMFGWFVYRRLAERQEAETALQKSEEQFRRLFDGASDAVFVHDREGQITDVNMVACNSLGYSRKELLGMSVSDIEVVLQPAVLALLWEGIRSGKSATVEGMHRRRDGSTFPVEVHITLFSSGENCLFFAAARDITERKQAQLSVKKSSVFVDITERKRAEEDLLEKEGRYRLLFESANDGIFILDETGFIDCNRRGAEMYGRTREEVIGHSPVEFAPERQPDGRLSSEWAKERIQKAINNIPQVFEWQSLRSDGSLFDVEITLNRFDIGGRLCLQAIVRDITDRKRLEMEISRAQKLESIGSLAGGIAHDFNNLLQGVFGYISLAKLKRDDREKSIEALEEAEKALHMSVNLTNQLLTFSKGGKPVIKTFDLLPMIEKAANFALSGSCTDYMIIAPEGGIGQVEADEGQISQVIQNIVLNADQSMPDGGQVEISLQNVSAPGKNLPPVLFEGKYIEIAIRDRGIGIPTQYLAKIFDPYFTTKEKGSGLGLATSYSIIKNHNGLIDVKSEPGKGTTFFIYIPATEMLRETAPQYHEIKKAEPRAANILLMDDEEIVRNVAGALIRELGHRVEFAVSGEDAIEKIYKSKGCRHAV